MDRPNIVLIMTDTQGTNVIGCYGRPELKTPRIDGLASEGVKFDRAYTSCPVCGPSRSSIFTGNYPHTTGVWANNLPMGQSIMTIGQRLSDHGYHTAFTGKWHLDGTDYFGNGKCPEGWDPDYWYDGRNYLDDLTLEERLRWREELNKAENIHKYGVTEEFTWANRCSNRAIEFLEKSSGDKPFFLVVSYDEPHGPSTCPPPYCDMFQDFEYELGENVGDPLDDKPVHQRMWAKAGGLPRDAETFSKPMFFGCNSYVDYEIGRVLDAVDKHSPDAMTIFLSDHGTPLLSHGLDSKGPAMYDETTRIPLIVRWRGVTPEEAVADHPVSHIDITPTIMEAAGLSVPPFLEGKSLMPVLENPEAQVNDVVFMEFNRFEWNHDGWGGLLPIRCAFDGRHKLVINLLHTDELYDIQEDPQEMVNLITDPGYGEVRNVLHKRILRWMDRTRDPFRGFVWTRRHWSEEEGQGWTGAGKTRPRPDDDYGPRVLLYETGHPVDRWEYDKEE